MPFVVREGVCNPPYSPRSPRRPFGFTSGPLSVENETTSLRGADVDVPRIRTESGHKMMSKLRHAMHQSCSGRIVVRNNSCGRGLRDCLHEAATQRRFFNSTEIFESKIARCSQVSNTNSVFDAILEFKPHRAIAARRAPMGFAPARQTKYSTCRPRMTAHSCRNRKVSEFEFDHNARRNASMKLVAIVFGLALLAVAGLPGAGRIAPGSFPGFDAASDRVPVKHGFASRVAANCCLAAAHRGQVPAP